MVIVLEILEAFIAWPTLIIVPMLWLLIAIIGEAKEDLTDFLLDMFFEVRPLYVPSMLCHFVVVYALRNHHVEGLLSIAIAVYFYVYVMRLEEDDDRWRRRGYRLWNWLRHRSVGGSP
jgi:hypothetical protein